MENEIPAYKIIRNIASDGQEYALDIKKWLAGSKENGKIYQDFLNIWQITGTFPNRFLPDRPKAWLKVQQQIHTRKKNNILYKRATQTAAAIIIIALSMWTGTKLRNDSEVGFTEIVAPVGQKTHVILPDSSTVLLNGDSRIRYRQDFSEHRNIELQGEGYFDVRKNLARQFIVSTHELKIKVFGTSFNVKAYDDDQVVEVGLRSGRVGIEGPEQTEFVRLVPGQLATFNRHEKKVDIKEMDMNLVSAWVRDELVFEENSMKEIVKYIERWYGIEIDLDPELMDGERLTFKVKTESLHELLSLINMFKPIAYQIDGKHVTITKP